MNFFLREIFVTRICFSCTCIFTDQACTACTHHTRQVSGPGGVAAARLVRGVGPGPGGVVVAGLNTLHLVQMNKYVENVF